MHDNPCAAEFVSSRNTAELTALPKSMDSGKGLLTAHIQKAPADNTINGELAP